MEQLNVWKGLRNQVVEDLNEKYTKAMEQDEGYTNGKENSKQVIPLEV